MKTQTFVFTVSLLCLTGTLFAGSTAQPTISPETAAKPAATSEKCFRKRNWYGYVGSGYAWSMKAGIHNPDSDFWAASDQGYDARLGNSPFFTIGFGRRYFDILAFDVAYTYYQTFHYQKFQTGETVPGGIGSRRTRYFDLDNQNGMFNISLYPEDHASFPLGSLKVSPFVGVGIGFSVNRISNFHSVSFDEATGTGSTTSIGNDTTTVKFAWQAMAGLRFHPRQNRFNFDVGYRYYDAGRFTGPNRIIGNTAIGQGIAEKVKPWKGRLHTNELTLTLNLSI